MENWWIEQNRALSPLSNVAPTNNIGVPNTVNYSRTWKLNTQNQPNFHGSMIYDTPDTFPNGLCTATVDTFIESFTQLTESISTNDLYNHASSNCNYPCMDNSSIHLANYRAITQYYNSRRFDINTNISSPLVTNRYVNQAAPFLNQRFRYLMPPHTTIANHSTSQPTTTTANFYPDWKNYQNQTVNSSNFQTKMEDVERPQSVQWNSSSDTYKSFNSSSSESDLSFITAEDLSDCDKNVEKEDEKRKKDNARKVQAYMDQYHDYTNPFCCEFCPILDTVTSKRALELHYQLLLLKKSPANPNELTNGIKMILSRPINKEWSNLSDLDGLTAFYLDDHKRKMKELFPSIDFDNNKNNCVIRGCNCRKYAMTYLAAQERLAENFVPSSGTHNFNDVLKTNYQIGKGQHESTSSSSCMTEENARRRMAELLWSDPLNNKWYMELLNGIWARERSRMPYTHNFGNVTRNTAGGDAENLSYTCDQISQLQEILLLRARK